MSGFVGHLHKQYKLAYDIMSLDGDNQFKVKQKDLDVGDAFLKFCTAYDLYAKVLVIPTAQKLAHDLYQTELTAKKEFDDDVNIYLQKFVVKDEVYPEQIEIQKLREEFEVSFRLIKEKYCNRKKYADTNVTQSSSGFIARQAQSSNQSFPPPPPPSGNANHGFASFAPLNPSGSHFNQPSLEFLLYNQQQALFNMANSIRDGFNYPKPELMQFYGDPTEYWKFIRNFDVNIGHKIQNDSTKLNYLIQLCQGNARSSIDDCVIMEPSRGYWEARNILHNLYGRPHIVAHANISKLINGPVIKSWDSDALLSLSRDMKKCCITLNQMGYTADMNSSDSLIKLMHRLPFNLQCQWAAEADRIIESGYEATFLDMTNFVERTARIANTLFGQEINRSRAKQRPKISINNRFAYSLNVESNAINSCNSCSCCDDKDHDIYECPQFSKFTFHEKLDFVRKNNLCINCLMAGHFLSQCPSQKNCEVDNCYGKHHTLMHKYYRAGNIDRNTENNTKNSVRLRNNQNAQVNTAEVVELDEEKLDELELIPDPLPRSINTTFSSSATWLRTLPVVVKANGYSLSTYALLDEGSQISLCDQTLIKQLGIKGVPKSISLSTVNSSAVVKHGSLVDLDLQSINGENNVSLSNVFCIDSLPLSSNNIPWVGDINKWEHLRNLEFSEIKNRQIRILIGCDNPEMFWTLDERRGGPKDPFAIKCPLGWTVLGPVNTPSDHLIVNHVSCSDLIKSEIESLWNTDFQDTNLSLADVGLSKNDIKAQQIMDNSIKFVNGKYELPLLWKNDKPSLKNNIFLAETRLKYLKNRLLKSESLRSKYTKVMQGYIDENYAEEVVEIKPNKDSVVWYLPHHPVVNPRKPDKLRIVYDCAAIYQGNSLNNELLQGPNNVNNLVGVLSRFRKEPIAIVADIASMFHQVKVSPNDRDALRFLWWKNGDLSKPPTTYRMTVHLFGATSSPSCATYCLQKTADDHESEFDDSTIKTLRDHFYVDDCLASVKTKSEAVSLIKDLTSLLKAGGFELTKWLSNDRDVLNSVDKSEISPTLNLDLNNLPINRTLGVSWDLDTDRFIFTTTDVSRTKPLTRRKILSAVSSLFDPLGIVAPYVIKAKIILQKLCKESFDWDDPIPPNIENEWLSWLDGLRHISNVHISRCFKQFGSMNIKSTQIHHFCDASMAAYGSVSYIRMVDEHDVVNVSFVCAKSRLAPPKMMSIPRLELSAAVTAVKCDRFIRRELRLSDEVDSIFWSDSSAVLATIRNTDKRFDIFVSNRIRKIEEGSKSSQWHFVNSDYNPADDVSRGLDAEKIHADSRWLKGPNFLWEKPELWPKLPDPKFSIDELEVKPSKQILALVLESSFDKLFTRFSCWNKLKRVICWLTKFKTYICNKVRSWDVPLSNKFSSDDVLGAENDILTYVQKNCFCKEIKHFSSKTEPDRNSNVNKAILRLNPFLENNLLKVGGRLKYSLNIANEKFPVILPCNHHVTDLIIQSFHSDLGHAGMQHTWSEIRKKYWILRGGVAVRRVIGKCFGCLRYRAKKGRQLMSDLPVQRITPDSPPFHVTGVDFFGPIQTKQGRSLVKRYGCLFTCLNMRAVHLEMAYGLDTDSFINAFRRFSSRRGWPHVVISDNATNFIGADAELKRCVRNLDCKKISKEFFAHNISWKFNTPGASHMGGAWERLIRSTRKVLQSILSEQSIVDDTLQTALAECESILNSRPLTKTSDDPYDDNTLTPNNLLMGDAVTNLPLDLFDRRDCLARKRWKQGQYLADVFWKRWKSEYLSLMQQRTKWTQKMPNYKVGDIVLLVDENTHRNQWPLAKVTKTFPDKEGFVRQVEIFFHSKFLTRPITKLCLLEGV